MLSYTYELVIPTRTLIFHSEVCMIFSKGSVPVSIVAEVYGKDKSWVRAGIISGWLPIGYATRNGKIVTKVEDINSRKGRINYYISPKLLYEQTGYLWEGDKRD